MWPFRSLGEEKSLHFQPHRTVGTHDFFSGGRTNDACGATPRGGMLPQETFEN